MANSSSPPPDEESALSGLFPSAPTLEAVHKAQRKQASQIVAIISANRDSVRRDREIQRKFDVFETAVRGELAKLHTGVDEVESKLAEFRLELLKDSIPEAQERGANNARLALLLLAAGLVSSGMVGLLFHFLGKGSP